MRNAVIFGTGAYLPERLVPNSFFNELLGEDVDAWLREHVEIYERRWVANGQSTADLCVAAGQQALERAGIAADALGLIIVATDTPEYISPSTAAVVQYRLGADKAGAFDINTACAGFVTALDIGAKFIRSDEQYEYILVIGAYAMSKYLNMTDKKTVTLFADGAGAVVLKAEEDSGRGFLGSKLISQGQYHDWMGIFAGGTHEPVSTEAIARHDHQLRFVRRFPTELNPDVWTQMIQDLCQRLQLSPDEVKHFFLTQINIFSIRETMDRLGQPHSKAHTIMHYYGYTGSACIPMAFNDAWEKNLLNPGELVFFVGSGGGLAFASAAFRL
jgi:3-oxoacyl-[acyl-carrier-protein] synthase III